MHRNKFGPPPLTIDRIKRPRRVSEQARRSALGLPGPIDRWLTANSCSNFAETFRMLSLCGVAELVQCTVKRVCIPVCNIFMIQYTLLNFQHRVLGSFKRHHILWPRYSRPIHICVRSDRCPAALGSNQPDRCAWSLCRQRTRRRCTWVDSGNQAWTCICSASCVFRRFICSAGSLGWDLESGVSILVYFQTVNWLEVARAFFSDAWMGENDHCE